MTFEMSGVGKRTRVLMALQHQLSNTSVGIPELHAAVLGTTENPVAVGGESDTEDEILHHQLVSERPHSFKTHTLWPSKVRMHLPPGVAPGMRRDGVLNSHILIVLSKLPLTRRSPEGANATL